MMMKSEFSPPTRKDHILIDQLLFSSCSVKVYILHNKKHSLWNKSISQLFPIKLPALVPTVFNKVMSGQLTTFRPLTQYTRTNTHDRITELYCGNDRSQTAVRYGGLWCTDLVPSLSRPRTMPQHPSFGNEIVYPIPQRTVSFTVYCTH